MKTERIFKTTGKKCLPLVRTDPTLTDGGGGGGRGGGAGRGGAGTRRAVKEVLS